MAEIYRTIRRRFFLAGGFNPVLGIMIALIVYICAVSVALAQASLPPGFIETVIATGIENPSTMTIAPDGRIFIAQQSGNVWVVENDVLLPDPFLSLDVNSDGERGLIGITVDPDFENNNYVYVYHTVPSPLHNRVSRFTANGNVAAADSETILVDVDPLVEDRRNHNGGGLSFGLDGKLYIGVGDNQEGSNSQTLTNRLGKVLRVNPDGSIPDDNPLLDRTTGDNQAIWAYGLRNPYNVAVDPVTGTLYINDVGLHNYEEINEGIAGANYGWPDTEGETDDPNYVSPLVAYPHGDGNNVGCAIVGGAFYQGDQFPTNFVGDYFYADYCNKWIRHYDTDTATTYLFASDTTASVVDVQVAPDGSLYYLARGSEGQLVKIEYVE